MISDNLEVVRSRIARCCKKIGRPPESVRLVCVTKEAGIADAEQILSLGVTDLGENRVQELVSKYSVIGDKATWHLVGHLQTNKVKDAVNISSLIHSVDSVRLAKAIDDQAKKINKIQEILIQVNTSSEKTKFGIAPEDIFGLFKQIVLYPNISVKGLMTMAPEADDPEKARPFFRMLRELLGKVNAAHRTQYTVLSMGMTNDFEIAIEEGSNMIRIGRAIFGE